MKKIIIRISFVTIFAVCITSCTKDLNQYPKYGINSGLVYSDPNNYINLLAKLYAGFAVTGQTGATGSPDITNFNNEGYTQYIREVWNLQNLTTDGAFWTYNDPGIYDLHNMTWGSTNQWVTACYDRILYEVTLCNSFISNCSDDNISIHKFTGQTATNIKTYRAEARFLKAIALWHGLDLFGNLPDLTDETKFPGGNFPQQISRASLFNYIESELLSIEGEIAAPRTNEYGRADQACVWSLLAHLYLNAGVYTGTNRYTDAITYCNKVIGAGYSLSPSYRSLFLADNDVNAGSQEIIFSIGSDGKKTQGFGGTSYLCDAPVDNTPDSIWHVKDSIGIDGNYHRCLHTTSAFVKWFDDDNGFPDSLDQRYLFFKRGQSLEMDGFSAKPDVGWMIIKYRNITSAGLPGSNLSFADIDFPLFRLADIYLIYAEAVLQGGAGGDVGTAMQYINALRQRAFGNSSHNISSLTMDVLKRERTREMEHEGYRRSDLIRWGMYTGGTYNWPYKGNVLEGKSMPDYYNLFPIPNNDIIANPNLKQNPGY